MTKILLLILFIAIATSRIYDCGGHSGGGCGSHKPQGGCGGFQHRPERP